MSDWVKSHRAMTKHEIWRDKPFARGQAWLDLIFSASWKDTHFTKRGIKIEQKRGVVATSMHGLSDRWGWSIGKVKRFLMYLDGELQTETKFCNVTTLITILNYDAYQGERNANGTQTVEQTETIEEVKKLKKRSTAKKDKQIKLKYGEYRNVLLTENEHKKLVEKFNGRVDDKIRNMDEAVEMKGYKYKIHYLAILAWDTKEEKEKGITNKETTGLGGRIPYT